MMIEKEFGLIVILLFLLFYKGTLAQCSKFADRMEKKQVHPEIESDYERVRDENQPEQPIGEIPLALIYRSFVVFLFLIIVIAPIISTLKTIPFGSE